MAMNPNKTKLTTSVSGFTLIEVLFATAITAMLLGAISLNLGVKPALQKAVAEGDSSQVLLDRLESILIENTTADLIALEGVTAGNSSLSDPAGTSNRILVGIKEETVGFGDYETTLYVISVTSSDGEFTRWFSP